MVALEAAAGSLPHVSRRAVIAAGADWSCGRQIALPPLEVIESRVACGLALLLAGLLVGGSGVLVRHFLPPLPLGTPRVIWLPRVAWGFDRWRITFVPGNATEE